jgi:TetR/AcrR family transcriptional regulator
MTHKESDQMSRKDRERERHCREILEAAERIFANKGYYATTIEEIAKEAQFAVGTLYNLFKGKDDLYTRVIESCFRDFMERFEEKVLSIEDPEEALVALIELRLTHFHEHREFIRVIFETSPGSRMDPVRILPPQLATIHDQYTKAVTNLFKQGISQGIFDEADPLYHTLCLEGIINAFVAYWSRHTPTEPLTDRVAKISREFLGRIKLRLNGSTRSVAAS